MSRDDFEGMQGHFWRPDRYRAPEGFDTDGGQGSSRITYGALDDGQPRPDEDHVWFTHEYTGGGDYGGSGLVSRANFETLREEAERLSEDELGGDTSWYQTFFGDYGTYEIAFHVDKTPDEIIEMLAGLSDYVLIDDNKHSELEVEAENEAWSSWAERDYRRALGKKFAGDADAVDDDVLKEHFFEAMEEANENWVNEEGDSMWIDVEKIADAADEAPEGFVFDSDQNGMSSNAGKYYEVEYYHTDDADWTETNHVYIRAESKEAALRDFEENYVAMGEESVWETEVDGRPEGDGDFYYYMGVPEEEGWESPVWAIKLGPVRQVKKSEVDEDRVLG